jgi:hypothetical protein
VSANDAPHVGEHYAGALKLFHIMQALKHLEQFISIPCAKRRGIIAKEEDDLPPIVVPPITAVSRLPVYLTALENEVLQYQLQQLRAETSTLAQDQLPSLRTVNSSSPRCRRPPPFGAPTSAC